MLLDQHLTLECFTMDIGSLKGHLLKCKLLDLSSACVLHVECSLHKCSFEVINFVVSEGDLPKILLCFNTGKLWSLENLALRCCCSMFDG